jgi:hypothetical protein
MPEIGINEQTDKFRLERSCGLTKNPGHDAEV